MSRLFLPSARTVGRVRLVVLLPIVTLLFGAFAFAMTRSANNAASDWVTHTQGVLAETERTTRVLQTADATSVRAAADPSPITIAARRDALDELQAPFADIASRTVDNPEQNRRLVAFQETAEQARRALLAWSPGQPVSDLAQAGALTRQATVDADLIGNVEAALLQQRLADQETLRWLSVAILILAAVLAIGASIVSARTLDTILRAEQRARDQLTEAWQEAETARIRLRDVMEVLPEGVLIVDSDGSVRSNDIATRICRGPVTQVPVHTLDGRLLTLEEIPVLRAFHQGIITTGQRFIVCVGPELEERHVLLSAAPLRNSAGEIVGAVGVIQDIEEIRALEMARVTFAAAASHDLRNPLTSLQTEAQALARRARRGPLGMADAAAIASRLTQAAADMGSLIDEILDVARVESDAPIQLDLRPANMTDVVAAAIRAADAGRTHPIVFDPSPEALEGQWDTSRLSRVYQNLLGNAAKYSPAGTPIEVCVEGAADTVLVEVIDRGRGIPDDELATVFERFKRASNTGRIRGSGVGLAAARAIVERHGGQITVTSQVGTGSRFVVRLPRHPSQPEP